MCGNGAEQRPAAQALPAEPNYAPDARTDDSDRKGQQSKESIGVGRRRDWPVLRDQSVMSMILIAWEVHSQDREPDRAVYEYYLCAQRAVQLSPPYTSRWSLSLY